MKIELLQLFLTFVAINFLGSFKMCEEINHIPFHMSSYYIQRCYFLNKLKYQRVNYE